MTNAEFVATVAWHGDRRDSSGRVSAEQRPGAQDTLAQQTDTGRPVSLHTRSRPRGCTPARLAQNRFALRKAGKSGFSCSDCSWRRKPRSFGRVRPVVPPHTHHHTWSPLLRAVCRLYTGGVLVTFECLFTCSTDGRSRFLSLCQRPVLLKERQLAQNMVFSSQEYTTCSFTKRICTCLPCPVSLVELDERADV